MKVFVNLLTTIRFIGAFFLPYLLYSVSTTYFIVLIAILFFTDFLDGYFARKFKVQTIYGMLMDTIADKSLNIILILSLIPRFSFITCLLVMEVLIAVVNLSAALKGKKTESSIYGKTKMWFIAFSVIMGYLRILHVYESELIYEMVMITFLLQLLTFINYVQSLQKTKIIPRKKELILTREQLFKQLFDTEYYLKIKK